MQETPVRSGEHWLAGHHWDAPNPEFLCWATMIPAGTRKSSASFQVPREGWIWEWRVWCVLCCGNFFNLKKIQMLSLLLVSALHALESFFFPPFFLCPFLSRCQKTEGERVNIFTHSPLPPHTYTNSCHIWFCGIWYFEQNDFLIFQSNIIINFTIEDCVHVKPWLPLISNGWGGREKSWRTVLSDKPAIGF